MKQKYSMLIITNLPAFYKLNLYNLIAKKRKMFVVFTGTGAEGRNKDFYKGRKNFDYTFLKGNVIRKTFHVLKIVFSLDYEEILIGGWDSLIMLMAASISSKKKNSVVVESSIFESTVKGWKGFSKRLFLKKINKAYVSGISNEKLVRALGFKGKVIRTNGVGVFNYIPQPKFEERNKVKKFLYVGRLVEVKNLKFLIDVFNELPGLELTIAGFGEQDQELKTMAGKNIYFLGAVNNKKLPHIYQSHDVFILPSKSEPWGLVVEEALNNGLPVIVSNMVGCHEAIVNRNNGLVFKYDDKNALFQAIEKMTDVKYYNQLRKNISKYDFEKIEQEQVNCYI